MPFGFRSIDPCDATTMIEFKAECGHTVRARDEDAGGVVRCSYCGREAAVPDSKEDDLDFLFKDVEQQPETTGRRRRRRRAQRAAAPATQRPGRPVDPFAVIFKLCWAAALITIVIVVGRKWVLPLIRGEERPRIVESQDAEENAPTPKRGLDRSPKDVAEPASTSRYGLKNRAQLKGLYVSATPAGATGYFIESRHASAHTTGTSIRTLREAKSFTVGRASDCDRLNNGTYIVEISFPWNHPSLTGYEGYREFRRSLETANQEKRRLLMEQYFLPDEHSHQFVYVDEFDGQIYLVRQYDNAVVRNSRSPGVRSLFLPRIYKEGQDAFAIERLVVEYFPETVAYRFDEDHVRNELDYYGVAVEDRSWVLTALQRTGQIPYITPDGRERLLKIGIDDGNFTARELPHRTR